MTMTAVLVRPVPSVTSFGLAGPTASSGLRSDVVTDGPQRSEDTREPEGSAERSEAAEPAESFEVRP